MFISHREGKSPK